MKKLISLFFLLFFLMGVIVSQPFKNIAYCTGSVSVIKTYPLQKLTHIIYSFLKIQNDTLTFHNDQQKQNLIELVSLKKQYPHLKIMVSVGGWGGCGFCSALFADSTHRINFARTTVELFKEYGIDGLDLDWEYPAIEGFPGHLYQKADRKNFTALVQNLRNEMGNRYLLTFAAGGFIQYLEHSINWSEIHPLVDFINLMTYDLVGGYSTVTGHHTPLKSAIKQQESTQKCVDWLLQKKVPAHKLIIGAAFYARVWENVSSTNHGLYQNGRFKTGVAFKNFATYFSDTMGFVSYWDSKAKAPFRYSASRKLFATFDDIRSVKEKAKFVRRKKLGGIMFWELNQDLTIGGLLDNIATVLNR